MSFSQTSLDVNSFWDYWERLKTGLNDLINAGAELIGLQNKYEDLLSRAQALEREDLSEQIEGRLLQVTNDYSVWEEIKAKIDQWLPNWMRIGGIASSETSSESRMAEAPASGVTSEKPLRAFSGFGFILPAWAIAMLIAGGLAAIVFVVTEGMKLLKRLSLEKTLIADIERGVLTAEQAAQIIGPEPEEAGSSITKVIKQAGNIGLLAVLAIAGIAVYKSTKK